MPNKRKSNSFYKIFNEELGLVIPIRVLSQDEEIGYYNGLVAQVTKLQYLNVEAYKKEIVKGLVANRNFMGDLRVRYQDNPSGENEIIDKIFEAILEIYPAFSIHVVLRGQNVEVYQGNINDMLEDLYGSDPEEGEGKKVAKGKSPTPKKKTAVQKQPPMIMTKERLTKLLKALKSTVKGQDEAIETVYDRLKIIAAGLESRGVFLFVGPTGVGKTLMARTIAKNYGAGEIKINCGDYGRDHEYAKLIGSPPGYIGHSDQNFLSEKAEKSNQWVFVFDEIEKASDTFFNLLLNLFDEGVIVDSCSRTLDFTNSIFILTSNQGMNDTSIGKKRPGFGQTTRVGYEESREEVEESIRKKFTPEFRNRIDANIYFNVLTDDVIRDIIKINLKTLPLRVTKTLVSKILEDCNTVEFGAREVPRYIKKHLSPIIADCLLDRRAPKDSKFYKVVVKKDGTFEVQDTVENKEPTFEERLKEVKRKVVKSPTAIRRPKT